MRSHESQPAQDQAEAEGKASMKQALADSADRQRQAKARA